MLKANATASPAVAASLPAFFILNSLFRTEGSHTFHAPLSPIARIGPLDDRNTVNPRTTFPVVRLII
jgi:hypothetical protein